MGMIDPSVQKQIFDHLNKASRILIPLGINPSGDGVAAALALSQFLKKIEKDPQVVCAGNIPEKLKFLPGTDQVVRKLEESRGFVISVRTAETPLDELSYHLDEKAGVVNIYLKPKDGQYSPDDVTFRLDKFPYDLVVALDLPSLDLLGDLYDKNTDLFFETPIINIDHHPNNEHFGEINLVDITATSTTEILMELLENFEAGLIDSDIATNLLAGILVETNSFQHIKTTPKAFLKASSLISLGANQQEIIKHLYKTKSVSLLKLWGRALARLKEVPELGLVYSMLKADDLAKSGSREVKEVMSELVASLSDNKIILLLAEEAPGVINGYYHLHPNIPALEVANLLTAEMTNSQSGQFRFSGKTLAEAEAEVLSRLEKIKNKLGG